MATGGGELSITLLGGSEPFYEFPCSLCEVEERNVEAEKYCQECLVFMCSSCVLNHNRFPLNKAHMLLMKNKFAGLKKPVSFPTKRCLTHPGELINFYCGNHDVVCCGSCKVLEHSKCSDTKHLTDAAKGVFNTQAYKNVKNENTDFIADVATVIADRNSDIVRIINKKKEIKQFITHYRKKIEKYYDDIEELSLEELRKIAEKMVDDSEQDIKDLAAMKSNAESIKSQLESYTGSNECDLFSKVKMAEMFQRDARQKVLDVSKNVQREDINFTVDPRFDQLFSSVTNLGTFTNVTLKTTNLAKTLEETNIILSPTGAVSKRISPKSPVLLDEYKTHLCSKVNIKQTSGSKKYGTTGRRNFPHC